MCAQLVQDTDVHLAWSAVYWAKANDTEHMPACGEITNRRLKSKGKKKAASQQHEQQQQTLAAASTITVTSAAGATSAAVSKPASTKDHNVQGAFTQAPGTTTRTRPAAAVSNASAHTGAAATPTAHTLTSTRTPAATAAACTTAATSSDVPIRKATTTIAQESTITTAGAADAGSTSSDVPSRRVTTIHTQRSATRSAPAAAIATASTAPQAGASTTAVVVPTETPNPTTATTTRTPTTAQAGGSVCSPTLQSTAPSSTTATAATAIDSMLQELPTRTIATAATAPTAAPTPAATNTHTVAVPVPSSPLPASNAFSEPTANLTSMQPSTAITPPPSASAAAPALKAATPNLTPTTTTNTITSPSPTATGAAAAVAEQTTTTTSTNTHIHPTPHTPALGLLYMLKNRLLDAVRSLACALFTFTCAWAILSLGAVGEVMWWSLEDVYRCVKAALGAMWWGAVVVSMLKNRLLDALASLAAALVRLMCAWAMLSFGAVGEVIWWTLGDIHRCVEAALGAMWWAAVVVYMMKGRVVDALASLASALIRFMCAWALVSLCAVGEVVWWTLRDICACIDAALDAVWLVIVVMVYGAVIVGGSAVFSLTLIALTVIGAFIHMTTCTMRWLVVDGCYRSMCGVVAWVVGVISHGIVHVCVANVCPAAAWATSAARCLLYDIVLLKARAIASRALLWALSCIDSDLHEQIVRLSVQKAATEIEKAHGMVASDQVAAITADGSPSSIAELHASIQDLKTGLVKLRSTTSSFSVDTRSAVLEALQEQSTIIDALLSREAS